MSSLREAPMRPYQWLVVAMCLLVNTADGFDFFVMGFVLPHLPADFAGGAVKGLLVSAGLVGIGLGALFVAPLADRFGRRTLLIAGLTVDVVGMVASALAPTAGVLLAARVLTGVGVGVLSATYIVLATEFSSARRHNLVVGIIGVGFPLGSTLAGAVGLAVTVDGGDWRALFWAGAALSLAVLVASVVLVPESLEFLAARRDPRSRERARRLARRLRLDAPPEPGPAATAPDRAPRGGLPALLAPPLRAVTLLLWLGYFGLLAAFYFVSTWTPQLVTLAGGDAARGALTGTVLSVGGVLGSLLFGIIGLRVGATRVAWIALAVAALGVVVFSLTVSSPAAVWVGGILGLAVFVTVAAFTALAPPRYPVHLRASGYGAMLGVGRVGGIVAPVLAGAALAVVSPAAMYLASALPLLLAFVAALALARRTTTPATARRRAARH
ncbi:MULTISPECIES: MFS transporter [unclassified Pseudonocardia]|uniref:MFS transporter n=1 Tax=unclassified Pseudonocardia TaxID=2619320 RepID=UPI001D03C2CF|nr:MULTISPECIES: MFS transporter [unclassified Pseudonocardia]